jgi:hypothetical protein
LQESKKRKRLLNQVIELKGNIRVYVRIRPFLAHELANQTAECKNVLGG